MTPRSRSGNTSDCQVRERKRERERERERERRRDKRTVRREYVRVCEKKK